MKAILILANGSWNEARDVAWLRRIAEDADRVVATDGALDRATQCQLAVDLLIGDLDSLANPANLEQRFPNLEIHRYPEDKDQTDLELAIDWALRQSPKSILIYGATGGRIDHTMANLALLEKGLHSGIPIQIISPSESVQLIQGDHPLDGAIVGDRVSLLPISLFCTVSTQGLLYPLEGEKLFRGQGRGISNVVAATPARVTVESGVLAVVCAASGRGAASGHDAAVGPNMDVGPNMTIEHKEQ